MSKKILTIDFDIVMYPCLQIYNDYVSGNANPTENWEYLKRERGIEPFMRYDAKTLMLIGRIINKQRNVHNAHFFVCSEHQEVVDNLKLSDTFNEDKFDIVNIDFHHDIWYRPEDKNILLSFDDYNCSNWLGYLILKEKTESVQWYGAHNSSNFFDNEYKNGELPYTRYRLDELSELENIAFDEVYFVLSPQWVPYEFCHLFDLIINLTDKGE